MNRLLKQITIRKKILLMPIIAGVTFSVITLMSLYLNYLSDGHSRRIQEVYYPLMDFNYKLDQQFSLLQRELQDAVAAADSEQVMDTYPLYRALIDSMALAVVHYTPEEDSLRNLREAFTKYYAIASEVSLRMISEGTVEELMPALSNMSLRYNRINRSIYQNSQRYQAAIQYNFSITRENHRNMSLFSSVLTLVGLLIIGVLSVITTRSITHPLDEVVQLANQVTRGQFNQPVRISGHGEFGVLRDAFQRMLAEIATLISDKDKAYQTVMLSKSFLERNAAELETVNLELKIEIEERKKAEDELNLHRYRLEEMVEARTSELQVANQSLTGEIDMRRQVEKKQSRLVNELESVNQELKSFAYVVSHDLKAPLRAIGSLSDWLINDYQEALGEEGQELVKLLNTRVRRMHSLIEGILEYSRLGRVREDKIEIDLNTIANAVLDALEPPEHITIHLPANLPRVIFERTRIIQLFQNLLGNAIKYMDKERGLIVMAFESSGNFWKFSITDNGPGIEERHFHKIFQIFQTLKARDDFESTGVGLTLVKRIVEMYGGRIWLESIPGEGTTFFFTIPKMEHAVELANQEENKESHDFA